MSRKKCNFRRCHVCGATNESSDEDKISKCSGCGRNFAPFFYFEISDIEGFDVDQSNENEASIRHEKERARLIRQAKLALGIVDGPIEEENTKIQYKPLKGLALVW
jgi:ribosomal protein L37AE/L43A